MISYQRIGEAKYPSTNTPLDLLDAHIAYLKGNGFTVLPLTQVVDAIMSGGALPERTVAITIDDAYRAVVTEAWPRFKRAGMPITLFVPTGAVGGRAALTWDEIRALTAEGVEIGAHSHGHAHMAALSEEAMRADLALMNERFIAELGRPPRVFAYPYGEAGPAEIAAVKAAGYGAAFGESSGPIYAEANSMLLPRFMMNGTFGAMERFKLIANTLPLRAVVVSPASAILGESPLRLHLALADPPDLSNLACYGPHGARLPIEIVGNVVSVTPLTPFPAGQVRVNCTVRAAGRWHWWGNAMVAGGKSQGVAMHPRSLPQTAE